MGDNAAGSRTARVIGIDVGGTTIKGIVTDDKGTLLESLTVPTDAAKGKDYILASLEQLMSELLRLQPGVRAAGIASAGRIDARSGEVVFATDNLPGWQGMRLVEWTRGKFGLSAAADNDANAALLGEAWLGSGGGAADLVMLTLGTGVGGANMIGGRIVRGARWYGGEWGHSVLVPGGRPCNCGRRGCAEQYVSGTALARDAAGETGRPYAGGGEVLRDAARGDEAALRLIGRFAGWLAILIANLAIGLDPQAVIVGGGLADSRNIWWPQLLDRLRAEGADIEVRPASLGNLAGCYGAARLALALPAAAGSP